jgi:cytoskeletal protein CcmA (bactofilin family)
MSAPARLEYLLAAAPRIHRIEALGALESRWRISAIVLAGPTRSPTPLALGARDRHRCVARAASPSTSRAAVSLARAPHHGAHRETGCKHERAQVSPPLRERSCGGYNVCPMDPTLPSTEITALLGRGTSFEGKLHFEGRVRIDGKFQGEIRSDDVLIVGEGAEIDAEIRVGTAIIKGGTLRGSVLAAQSIELYVPARVNGTLHSPEIFMDKGVQFSGTCTIAALDEVGAATDG